MGEAVESGPYARAAARAFHAAAATALGMKLGQYGLQKAVCDLLNEHQGTYSLAIHGKPDHEFRCDHCDDVFDKLTVKTFGKVCPRCGVESITKRPTERDRDLGVALERVHGWVRTWNAVAVDKGLPQFAIRYDGDEFVIETVENGIEGRP